MARIRTIKPDFWTNEKVLSIKPLTRLLFIGMWNFADDYGRLDFSPISIKAKIFPGDQMAADDVRNMLNELLTSDLLKIYSANGKDYIEITGWDHQRIDKRQASKIPGPFDECSSIRGIPPTPTDLPRLAPTPTAVMEGNGREWKEDIRAVAKATRPDDDFEDFWKAYPRREGANPKEPAAKLFRAAVKRGENPRIIVAGAVECAIRESKNVGTPYIPQAVKWLRDKRWQDYNVKADAPVADLDWDKTIAFYAETKVWSRWAGPEPGQLGCRAPPEILQKHGITEAA